MMAETPFDIRPFRLLIFDLATVVGRSTEQKGQVDNIRLGRTSPRASHAGTPFPLHNSVGAFTEGISPGRKRNDRGNSATISDR